MSNVQGSWGLSDTHAEPSGEEHGTLNANCYLGCRILGFGLGCKIDEAESSGTEKGQFHRSYVCTGVHEAAQCRCLQSEHCYGPTFLPYLWYMATK